jgi:hypothetical protein
MLQALLEKAADLGDDVAVARVALHRAWLAEHVHEAHVAAALGDERRHLRVAAQRGDVVDERRARVDRRRRDRGLRRVDRQPRAGAGQALEHRQHAAQLLGLAHGLGAGPGRLAADVEDRGALRDERVAVGDRGGRVQPLAAVGERVGRDVDDAHHDRLGNGDGHRTATLARLRAPPVAVAVADPRAGQVAGCSAYARRPISGSTPKRSA